MTKSAPAEIAKFPDMPNKGRFPTNSRGPLGPDAAENVWDVASGEMNPVSPITGAMPRALVANTRKAFDIHVPLEILEDMAARNGWTIKFSDEDLEEDPESEDVGVEEIANGEIDHYALTAKAYGLDQLPPDTFMISRGSGPDFRTYHALAQEPSIEVTAEVIDKLNAGTQDTMSWKKAYELEQERWINWETRNSNDALIRKDDGDNETEDDAIDAYIAYGDAVNFGLEDVSDRELRLKMRDHYGDDRLPDNQSWKGSTKARAQWDRHPAKLDRQSAARTLAEAIAYAADHKNRSKRWRKRQLAQLDDLLQTTRHDLPCGWSQAHEDAPYVYLWGTAKEIRAYEWWLDLSHEVVPAACVTADDLYEDDYWDWEPFYY